MKECNHTTHRLQNLHWLLIQLGIFPKLPSLLFWIFSLTFVQFPEMASPLSVPPSLCGFNINHQVLERTGSTINNCQLRRVHSENSPCCLFSQPNYSCSSLPNCFSPRDVFMISLLQIHLEDSVQNHQLDIMDPPQSGILSLIYCNCSCTLIPVRNVCSLF